MRDQVSTTKMICSHSSFQIFSEQFLFSTASKSTQIQHWTGISWTLPWLQRSFTSCVFLPSITSTSHLSWIFRCLVSFHRSTFVGSIYPICRISTHMERIVSMKLSRRRWCLKFVNSIFQNLPIRRRWYLFHKTGDRLSTSWILDEARYVPPIWQQQSSGPKIKRMFNIYCRFDNTLKL